MEYEPDDLRDLPSHRLTQDDFKQQLEKVAEIAATAKSQIDYERAHDPKIRRAIQIVEKFLRKTRRICYGGQALNAHLPVAYQFYDPETSVPDYDFFTPDQDKDLVELVKALQAAGFTDISARLGIHEGTIKVYADYFPIADITQMDPALYSLLSSRAYVHNKISYLDADTLRMLVYLELSRPKGEVDRWEKVYQRLLLLDNFVPLGRATAAAVPSRRTTSGKVKGIKSQLNRIERETLMKYITQNHRVFAGADLVSFFDRSLKMPSSSSQSRKKSQATTRLAIGHHYPIVLFVKDIKKEGELLKDILQDAVVSGTKPGIPIKPVRADLYGAVNGDMLPEMVILYKGGKAACLLIQESACHSYYNFVLATGENLRIASVDTLVTLFFALGIRGMGAKAAGDEAGFLGAFESLARQLVRITRQTRQDPGKFPFPFLALECEGEQPSFESLVKEKAGRMRRESVRQRLRYLKELVKQPAAAAKAQRTRRTSLLSKTLKNGRRQQN
jgi:Poly(A) polymerase catalytic subunit